MAVYKHCMEECPGHSDMMQHHGCRYDDHNKIVIVLLPNFKDTFYALPAASLGHSNIISLCRNKAFSLSGNVLRIQYTLIRYF